MPRMARRDIFALWTKQIRYVLRTRYIASQFDMLTPRCGREWLQCGGNVILSQQAIACCPERSRRGCRTRRATQSVGISPAVYAKHTVGGCTAGEAMPNIFFLFCNKSEGLIINFIIIYCHAFVTLSFSKCAKRPEVFANYLIFLDKNCVR